MEINLNDSIVAVIKRYTVLKPSGRELKGLCPFHSEKIPSFFVSEEKGLFHCFGCQEGGNLISFVMKAEGLDFRAALDFLGLEDGSARAPGARAPREEAAKMVAWAEGVSRRIAGRLRDLGFEQQLLDQFQDNEVRQWKLGSLKREWAILTSLDGDLFDVGCLPEFYMQRQMIEGLLSL